MKSWLDVIKLLLLCLAEEWLRYLEKTNPEDIAVRDAQLRRLEFYKAMAARDSGLLSRIAASRHDRLSVLLMGLPKDDPGSD